ncbi:MAG: hypothetical protein EOO59_18765, partial [Hymenobacter sp.]
MTGLVLLAVKLVVVGRALRRSAAGLLGLLLLSQAGWAQPSQVFQFARPRAKHATLKFDIQRNLIIVAARLNGQGPYHFLLDTGVSTSLLTNPALADSLHLVRGEELRVIGAGGEDTPLRAYRTDQVRVELPGLVAPN